MYGYGRRYFELLSIINNHDPDVVFLNETHLLDDETITIPNYATFVCNRSSSNCLHASGGSAILVKLGSCSVRKVEDIPDIHGEWIAIKARFKNNIEIILGTGYNPPNTGVLDLTFVKELFNFRGLPCILGGDLNARCLETGCSAINKHGKVLTAWLDTDDNVNLLSSPDKPTHFGENINPSVLDIWLSNNDGQQFVISEPTVHEQFGSDHAVTSLELSLVKGIATADLPSSVDDLRYNMGAANWPFFDEILTGLLRDIEHLKPKRGDQVDKIDVYYHAIVEAILKAADAAIPKCKVSEMPTFRLTKVIAEAIKARSKAERLYKRFKTQALKMAFNEAHRHVAHVVGVEQNRKLVNDTLEIERLFKLNQSRRAWAKAKHLMNGRKSGRRNIPTLQLGNSLKAESELEKANALGQLWQPVFSEAPRPPNSSKSDREFWEVVDNAIDNDPDLKPFATIPLVFTHNITRKALKRHLERLSNRAPGTDGIFNNFIKKGGLLLEECLHHLFNCCLNSGYMPSDWKIGCVVPVPKAGKKATSPEGYRPISLLATISKLLESIITSFLARFCERNNFFPSHQAGFRRYRRTIDAIMRLVHDIAEGRAQDHQLVTVAAFLDFKSAFDSVWHNGLRLVLKGLDLPKPVLRLLSHFLRGRKFFVKVGTSVSSMFDINCGVPQGSPLSPILFIIFTASMFRASVDGRDALKDIAFAAYADDVCLWASAHPGQCAVARVQCALRQIDQWSSKWRLAINPAKCEALSFSFVPFTKLRGYRLFVSGSNVKFSDSFRYLGLWLHPRLSWSKHIEEVSKKCVGALHALRSIIKSRRLNPSIGVLLYKALIRSIMEYGAPVWFATGFTDSLLHRLCAFERKCLRVILGLRKRHPTEDLFRLMKEKFPDFAFIPERLAELTFHYHNDTLSSSAEIGNIIRQCRDFPNPKSISPARFFLNRLLGVGPLPPLLEPIFEDDEVVEVNDG